MASLSPGGAIIPSVDTVEGKVWWEFCAQRKLTMQQCQVCASYRHPPSPICHRCQSLEYRWRVLSGKGSVYAHTRVVQAAHPAFINRVPYWIVLVELPDAGFERMVGNLVNISLGGVAIGTPVVVDWEEIGQGLVLPQWRLQQ